MARHSSAVVFDLDDTLIDTRRDLLPPALDRVARVLGVDPARLNDRGKRIDEVLVDLDVTPAQRAAAAEVWYAPLVPPLEPLPGAREALASLRGEALLVLLTRGDPVRQQRKIERCGLGPCFDEILIRPIEEPGSKRDDLEGLLSRHGISPARCAVVGDDPRDELKHAEELGCLTYPVPQVQLADLPRLLAAAGVLQDWPQRHRDTE